MKYLVRYSFALLLLLAFSSQSRSQYVYKDSANGIVRASSGVKDSVATEGPPDGQFGELSASGTAFLDMGFRRTDSSVWLPILPNSTLKIYGAKPKGVDSAAAAIQFILYASDGSIQAESAQFFASPGITMITVPDDAGVQYNTIEFTTTGGGTSTGSQGFNIDAITLFQNFSNLSVTGTHLTLAAGLIANYPNPFSASRGTTVQMNMTQSGIGSVVIFDAIGREIQRDELGLINAGIYTHTISGKAPGVYFARLLLDGIPYGGALKITSIR
jgi:hypothetical protein